ncbi:Hexosyltransferase [Aphelenchoides fujianensis]|nr:Hexosyltransferase [Aphelenchoides fujianensis]
MLRLNRRAWNNWSPLHVLYLIFVPLILLLIFVMNRQTPPISVAQFAPLGLSRMAAHEKKDVEGRRFNLTFRNFWREYTIFEPQPTVCNGKQVAVLIMSRAGLEGFFYRRAIRNTWLRPDIDDDTAFSLERLSYWTRSEILKKMVDYSRFALCNVLRDREPLRDQWERWQVPVEEYPAGSFPEYCNGAMYLLTHEAVAAIHERTVEVEKMRLEDVLFTGILAERANVTRFDTGAFGWKIWTNECSEEGVPLAMGVFSLPHEEIGAQFDELVALRCGQPTDGIALVAQCDEQPLGAAAVRLLVPFALRRLLVAFSASIPWALAGVGFAALSSGLGDVCFLALGAHYKRQPVNRRIHSTTAPRVQLQRAGSGDSSGHRLNKLTDALQLLLALVKRLF